MSLHWISWTNTQRRRSPGTRGENLYAMAIDATAIHGLRLRDSRDASLRVRVFQNAKIQNFKVGVSQNWLLYQTKSLQKELGFFLQNCGTAQFFRF